MSRASNMGIFEVVFPTDFVRRITKHRRRDFAATVGAIGFIISTHEIDRINFIRTVHILFYFYRGNHTSIYRDEHP